jgi:hypothetical protein
MINASLDLSLLDDDQFRLGNHVVGEEEEDFQKYSKTGETRDRVCEE